MNFYDEIGWAELKWQEEEYRAIQEEEFQAKEELAWYEYLANLEPWQI